VIMDDSQLPPRPSFLPPGFGTVGHQAFVEIIPAAPVPYTPQTSGWYVLGGVLLLSIARFIQLAVRSYRHNAYRRAALAELSKLRASLATDREVTLRHTASLLKRSALAVFPRGQVAPLSGAEWLEFLDRTGPGALSPTAKDALITVALDAPAQLSRSADHELLDGVERWVRRHRA